MTGPTVEEVKARLLDMEHHGGDFGVKWEAELARDALAVIELLQKENKDAFDRGIICADLSHATLEAEIASLRARLSRIEGAARETREALAVFLEKDVQIGGDNRANLTGRLRALDQALTEGEAK